RSKRRPQKERGRAVMRKATSCRRWKMLNFALVSAARLKPPRDETAAFPWPSKSLPPLLFLWLFALRPGEMARMAVEFLRENFQREQNACHSWREEFSRELRILNVGRPALRAAQGGADFRIGSFPF